MKKGGLPLAKPPISSGANEIRTHNLLDATEALSQLSYRPKMSAPAVDWAAAAPEGWRVYAIREGWAEALTDRGGGGAEA